MILSMMIVLHTKYISDSNNVRIRQIVLVILVDFIDISRIFPKQNTSNENVNMFYSF